MDDTFEQLKPGLSSYAKNPAEGAASLKPLMETAMKTVPRGATRGDDCGGARNRGASHAAGRRG